MSRTELAILDPVAYAEAMEAHVRKETREMALWSNQAEIDMLIAQLHPVPAPRLPLRWAIALGFGVGAIVGAAVTMAALTWEVGAV